MRNPNFASWTSHILMDVSHVITKQYHVRISLCSRKEALKLTVCCLWEPCQIDIRPGGITDPRRFSNINPQSQNSPLMGSRYFLSIWKNLLELSSSENYSSAFWEKVEILRPVRVLRKCACKGFVEFSFIARGSDPPIFTAALDISGIPPVMDAWEGDLRHQ